MAKIVDGGWLTPSDNNDENLTVGTFSQEVNKKKAQKELDKRLNSDDAEHDDTKDPHK